MLQKKKKLDVLNAILSRVIVNTKVLFFVNMFFVLSDLAIYNNRDRRLML